MASNQGSGIPRYSRPEVKLRYIAAAWDPGPRRRRESGQATAMPRQAHQRRRQGDIEPILQVCKPGKEVEREQEIRARSRARSASRRPDINTGRPRKGLLLRSGRRPAPAPTRSRADSALRDVGRRRRGVPPDSPGNRIGTGPVLGREMRWDARCDGALDAARGGGVGGREHGSLQLQWTARVCYAYRMAARRRRRRRRCSSWVSVLGNVYAAARRVRRPRCLY